VVTIGLVLVAVCPGLTVAALRAGTQPVAGVTLEGLGIPHHADVE
jgi:hypothetical protein